MSEIPFLSFIKSGEKTMLPLFKNRASYSPLLKEISLLKFEMQH